MKQKAIKSLWILYFLLMYCLVLGQTILITKASLEEALSIIFLIPLLHLLVSFAIDFFVAVKIIKKENIYIGLAIWFKIFTFYILGRIVISEKESAELFQNILYLITCAPALVYDIIRIKKNLQANNL